MVMRYTTCVTRAYNTVWCLPHQAGLLAEIFGMLEAAPTPALAAMLSRLRDGTPMAEVIGLLICGSLVAPWWLIGGSLVADWWLSRGSLAAS